MVTIGELLGRDVMEDARSEEPTPPPEPQKKVLAEGIITEIQLDPLKAEIYWGPGQEAVVFTFYSDGGEYVSIFDHRRKTVEAFGIGGYEEVAEAFGQTPCMGTMRRGRGQYISLADIGDPSTDIIGSRELVLFRGKFDKTKYRVPDQATHALTRISLLERKPQAD